MKKLLMLLLFASNIVFGQTDTLTPESKIRYRINQIRIKKSSELPDNAVGNVLGKLADMTAKRIPFITQKELRLGLADTANVVFINEGLRSGTFRYDPANKSVDDSSMILVSKERRYIREDVGYLRPEWFGANPNDTEDDADAIQKMFNKATPAGTLFHFSTGLYYVGKQINFKAVSKAPKWEFKITIEGSGFGRTKIMGKVGFKGDMFVIDTGAPSGSSKDNYITIEKIDFQANTANRILFGTEVVAMKIYDCVFAGGEDCGIQLGVEGAPGGYSVYMKNNYHNGQAYGSGQINSLLRLYSARFFVIDGMESDGGKYSIEMLGSCDKNIIINSKLEGAKRAAIFIDNTNGGGGGENQILNSTLNPYVGIEAKALFDGESNGIEINSRGGGNAFNTIRGNLILVNSLNLLPFIGTAKNVQGKLTVSADAAYYVTGKTSGAVGILNAWNVSKNRIIIEEQKGHFVAGETIVQGTTKATAALVSKIPTHSHGIKLSGGGGTNIISDNRIRLLPEFGIYNESNDNIIINNAIEAQNGILSTSRSGALISNNSIFSPQGIAVKRINGPVNYSNNRILSGSLDGITEAYLSTSGGTVEGNTSFKGSLTIQDLPVFADNVAATKAGLAKGTIYRTPVGELRIKY